MVQLKPVAGTDVFLWKYLPSIALSAIALGVFLALTCALSWRLWRTRSWFCIPFALGGLFQVIGYTVRIPSYYYTSSIALYVVQSSFVVIAPVFYAATLYMTAGRLMASVGGEAYSLIPHHKFTKLFVLGDWLALSIQGNAAGLTGKSSTQRIGQWLVFAGLIFQLLLFGFFIAALMVFQLRMHKAIKHGTTQDGVSWRKYLNMLYACSALIMVRCVFRAVEYTMGIDGYLLSHEWPMYVFDTLLMAIVQVVFLTWFPSSTQDRPAEDCTPVSDLLGIEL